MNDDLDLIIRHLKNSPARCQVPMIHADKSAAQCILHKDHVLNDSDHIDEHMHTAPVLVHQSTINEVRAVSEQVRRERERRESAYTLTVDDASDLLVDLGMPREDAEYALGHAAMDGNLRTSAGDWHMQIDHAGDQRFTVTVHAHR